MNDHLAEVIKNVYSRYHANEITAEQALDDLETAFSQENEDDDEKSNPYLSYSVSTLEQLAQDYSFKLGGGRTKLANGENLGEAYEQVLEALEQRQRTDYCKHGVFKWTDHDIPCGACEFE